MKPIGTIHSLRWVQHCNTWSSAYFTSKTVTLVLTHQCHSRSNLTVPIESPWLLLKKCSLGVQPRICQFSRYFEPKILTLTVDPSGSRKVKFDGVNRKPVDTFLYDLCWIQHRLSRRFQNTFNQGIVTLTFNLLKSSEGNPMGTLHNIHRVQHRNFAVLGTFQAKRHNLVFDPSRSSRSQIW